jgi:hypothetical protein
MKDRCSGRKDLDAYLFFSGLDLAVQVGHGYDCVAGQQISSLTRLRKILSLRCLAAELSALTIQNVGGDSTRGQTDTATAAEFASLV